MYPKLTVCQLTRTATTLVTVVGEEATVTEVSSFSFTSTATTTTTELSSVLPSSVETSTTVVTAPTTCPFFQLQVVGGATNGQYVLSQGWTQTLAFTASRGSAAVFQIDGAGQLVTGGFIADIDNASFSDVYLDTQETIDSVGYLSLICQKTPSLTCATSNGQTRFAVCPATAPGDPSPGPALVFGTTSTTDCSYITLTTLPAPQCA